MNSKKIKYIIKMNYGKKFIFKDGDSLKKFLDRQLKKNGNLSKIVDAKVV